MDPYSYNRNVNTVNNKVYINRNFNINGLEGASKTWSNSNVMYFNPNFVHTANVQHDIAIQRDHISPRIHVNPNFIRPKINVAVANTSQDITLQNLPRFPNTGNYQAAEPQKMQVHAIPKHSQMGTVSNSRYSLVRQNEVVKPSQVNSIPSNILQTVKVNKYKLVSLNSVKKGLTTDKSTTIKTMHPKQIKLNQTNIINTKYKISTKLSLNNVQNTRFKYVKRNVTSLKSSEHNTRKGIVRRVSITNGKNMPKTGIRLSRKMMAGQLKKNNIPCPLYKKYGKCLRMIKGRCDFLHDKKHVSICRKFLKGACHDKHCLLSHDLTDKKMPTCYFYLQGVCTKDGCPYLHVKLNEKTKICLDFLKGYCEKGDKCVHRHVNIGSKINTKSIKIKSRTSTNNTKDSFCIERTKKRKNKTKTNELYSTSHVVSSNADMEAAVDQRYFRDAAADEDADEDAVVDEQCDLIKPARCKLGTLPSFIQI